MQVKVEKLDHFGQGIARVSDIVTFIPYVIPGEVVDIDIINKKKSYNEGKCLNIIKSSDKRVKPFCPYFTKCGGCNLQHLNYSDTLDFKKNEVIDILNKNGLTYPSLTINGCNKEKFYRNKVSLKIINHKIGFYEEASHNIISISKCFIANDAVNSIINELEKMTLNDGEIVIRSNHNNEILISISGDNNLSREMFSKKDKIAGILVNKKVVFGDDFLITRINNLFFKYSYNSFFQVNHEIADKIFSYIKDTVKDKMVLDLYCGVGTLSLMASLNSKKVYGVEIVPNAIKNAVYNAKINKIDNAYFMLGDVSKVISKIKEKFDLVIVDPPRKGLDKIIINYLIDNLPQNIIYISCDAVTLGRDLKILSDYYEITNINLYDMFPYTYHVECVSVLSRKSPENKGL